MTRSKSSARWLHEHFSDPFVRQSQQQGYRSRAVFKLLAIQEKDRIITPGMTVVDLGAAPGGWSQVAAELVGRNGRVFALDILPMEPLEKVEFIQGDFTQPEVFEQLLEKIAGQRVPVVLSDMAPNTTGTKAVDQPRAMYLAELALDICQHILQDNGSVVIKVFQGEGFDQFLASMRRKFSKVTVRKPPASRARSSEVYLVGKGFHG
jgi:23S rRNA (uridine2552-2'-O)-methyltransferase